MYSCPGCGSQLLFDIPSQGLKCGRCDRTMTIEEADRKEAREASNELQLDLLSCPTCGAEIRAMNTAAASFCSYCGSSVMLNRREAKYDPPKELIPFQVTREQCFEKYQGMLKKSFCVDHRLKKNITADSFRGIYVPFHSYEATVQGDIVLEGSRTSGNKTYYYDSTIALNEKYGGIYHDASKEMPDVISEQIAHTDPGRFVPFSPAYLSGFYADVSDTKENDYIPYARAEGIRRGLEDAKHECLDDDDLNYSVGTAESRLKKIASAEYKGDALLPFWFMSMRSGKRVLYAVQNAVTGEMWADKPLDTPRFALLAGILAVILFFLFNSFLTLRPEMVMIAAMLLAVFAQVVVNGRRRKIKDREQDENAEIGEKKRLESAIERSKTIKRRISLKKTAYIRVFGVLILSCVAMYALSYLGNITYYKYAALALTAGMVLLLTIGNRKRSALPPGSIAAAAAVAAGCAILVLDPFHSSDLAVYAVTAAIMAAVIWECLDLLRLYNKSCSNPLPQFDTHQGGEEDHA